MGSPAFKEWMTKVGAVVAACAGFLSVGCGAYEPEPEYPQQYQYVAPTPPTAEELAAQQAARQQQEQENKEIVVGADADEYSDTDPGALTEFKPALEGHGTWVEDGTYGTVWVPASSEVGTDFQPYVTAGHWTYAEDTDYVWVSDYSWGWAPFHYGRWVYLPGHGWSWIPGRRYAGAWVTWRTGPVGYGYIGWAPMGPSWYWWHGAAIGWSFGWYHHHDYYAYCHHSHFYGSTYSPTHVVRGPAAREHYGRTADYQPAAPGVGGGQRVVANPGVGGSGGNGRVVANPGVGGTQRYVANPGVRGPRPDEIGANKDMVVAPPKDNAGLAKAQTYSQPKTAMAAGGAAPAQFNPGPGMTGAGGAGAGSSAGVNPRGPATSGFVPPPNVRGPSFSDRSGGVASTPPPSHSPSYANPTPSFRPSSPSASSPSYSSPPSSGGFGGVRTSPPSSSAFSSRPSSPSPNPAFRSSSPPPSSFGGGSSPTFRSSSPSVSSGSSFGRSPSVSSGSSFGGGARSSAPSGFRSSSPSVSAPSRSSGGGGSFSSSPARSAPSRSTSSSFRRR